MFDKKDIEDINDQEKDVTDISCNKMVDNIKSDDNEDDQIRDYVPSVSNTFTKIDDDRSDLEDDPEIYESEKINVSMDRQKNITDIIERKVNKAGKVIMIFNDYSSSINLSDISMETNDALYIDFVDQSKQIELIKKVRQSDLLSIFLIPIFISTSASSYNQFVTDLSDGVYLNINDESLISKTNIIEENIGLLKELHVDKYGKKVLYKLLRYMFTREYILEAYIDSHSIQGYIYPFLDIHYEGEAFISQQEDAILEEAEKVGLLKSTFIDKIHLCPQCNAGFHNFKELCPKCDSSNLSSQALIHHFVCANVGPERDYKKANLLICPKCSRELRHIGVDYDRPSVIFDCNNCGEYFQDPNIKAFCFNCKTENNVDDLKTKDIKNYRITRYGIGIVKASHFHEEYSESKFPGCYSYNVFRDLLKQEVRRIKTLNTQAICGSIYIKIKSDEEVDQELLDSVYMTASKGLTSSAASLCHFEDMFTFILPYTVYDIAEKEIDEIISAASILLNESFLDFDFIVKKNIIDIKLDDTEDELINNLIINV
jgi:hypothetical protein